MGRKKTYCDTCGWELDKFESEHPSLHKKNKEDWIIPKRDVNIKKDKDKCDFI